MGFWRKLWHAPLAKLALGVIGVVLFAGIFAPFLAPHDPTMPHLEYKLSTPSTLFPLGADHLGRCVLSRLLYGVRTTLFLAFFAMAITLSIGTLVGMLAGYFKRLDGLLMRLCDVMLSFPGELMILAIVGMLGPDVWNMFLAIILVKWAWYARMVRTLTLRYASMPYMDASRLCGTPWHKTLKRHLLPLLATDIAVLASLDMGAVILLISTLSFLGLGVQPPTPEWGMMLSEAKNIMLFYPEQMLPAGLAIILTVGAFNFLGDSIQNALNPTHVLRQETRP